MSKKVEYSAELLEELEKIKGIWASREEFRKHFETTPLTKAEWSVVRSSALKLSKLLSKISEGDNVFLRRGGINIDIDSLKNLALYAQDLDPFPPPTSKNERNYLIIDYLVPLFEKYHETAATAWVDDLRDTESPFMQFVNFAFINYFECPRLSYKTLHRVLGTK